MSQIVAVGPFILGKTLGTGATGKVKRAFHKETGFKVAIKIVSKENLEHKPAMLAKLEREIAIMKFLDHPNVLRLYDVYETSKFYFLVLEHVEGGELFDYLIAKGRLSPSEALEFFQQIISGLEYCHNHLTCHRDLKPENILLDSEHRVKICDFGMAALMKQGSLLATSCGSPHYASPEVITGDHYSGFEADIWSCGVILYALLVGKLPFDDSNMRNLLTKVKTGVFHMPEFLPRAAKDLIWSMLTVDPAKRITLQEIRAHPWFNANGSAPKPSPSVDSVLLGDAPLTSIDPELLRTLVCLWGEVDFVRDQLQSSKRTLPKIFYALLLRRRRRVEIEGLYGIQPQGSPSSSATSPISSGPGSPRDHTTTTRTGFKIRPGQRTRHHTASSALDVPGLAASTGALKQQPMHPSSGEDDDEEDDDDLDDLDDDDMHPHQTGNVSSPKIMSSAARPIPPYQSHVGTRRTSSPACSPSHSPTAARRKASTPLSLNKRSSRNTSAPILASRKIPTKKELQPITFVPQPEDPSSGSDSADILVGSVPKKSWFASLFTSPRRRRMTKRRPTVVDKRAQSERGIMSSSLPAGHGFLVDGTGPSRPDVSSSESASPPSVRGTRRKLDLSSGSVESEPPPARSFRPRSGSRLRKLKSKSKSKVQNPFFRVTLDALEVTNQLERELESMGVYYKYSKNGRVLRAKFVTPASQESTSFQVKLSTVKNSELSELWVCFEYRWGDAVAFEGVCKRLRTGLEFPETNPPSQILSAGIGTSSSRLTGLPPVLEQTSEGTTSDG